MELSRRLPLSIVASLVVVVVWAGAGVSNVPAPPANQRLGIDDGIFNNLTEADCRACHDDPSHPCSTSNIDRHHLMYGQPIRAGECSVNGNSCLSDADCDAGICENTGASCSSDPECPEAGLGETCGEVCRGETAAPILDGDGDGVNDTHYGCLNCHQQDTGGGVITFLVERDCLECHLQVPGEGSVHHLTAVAQGYNSPIGDPDVGDCTPCHGTIVDDIGDGHLIPVYSPSLVTPGASGGEGLPVNGEGNGAGACDYCHSTGTGSPVSPGTDGESGVLVYGNEVTHHNTGVFLSETGAKNQDACTWCHNVLLPEEYAIRVCEGCHGYESLHNIAADSDSGCFLDPGDPGCQVVIGGEAPGYSHVGHDDDCWGCHGFAQSGAPGSGPATPFISGADAVVVTAGVDTPITLTGTAFTNLVGSYLWVSEVRLTAEDGTAVTLQPESITEGSLTVTIPAGTAVGNYTLQAVKGSYAESNPVVISVKPEVAITGVVYNTSSGILTISGSGFGDVVPGGAEAYLTVLVDGSPVTAGSWTDTEITASVAGYESSSDIQVSALFCNDGFTGGEVVVCQVDADCDDGNPCNGEEVCDQQLSDCVAGTPPDCDDGVACTVDSCLPQTGCESTPNDGLCDDGDPETADSCDPAVGCVSCTVCSCNPNGDDKVDLADLTLLREEFLRTDCCEAGADPCRADCNGDCKVSLTDQISLKLDFMKTGCCN